MQVQALFILVLLSTLTALKLMLPLLVVSLSSLCIDRFHDLFPLQVNVLFKVSLFVEVLEFREDF
jgi:hypothetical protein